MANSHKHRVPAAFGGIMDVNTGRKKYFLGSVLDFFTETLPDTYNTYKGVVDTATSVGKAYLDYKDAKRRNELEEAVYDDYMAAAEAAGQEAQAAIDLNLTPMTVANLPTSRYSYFSW